MIGKLLKMVKSSNKKRGRNITVGAVVGMLLSCTVVMGGTIDVKATELEITKDPNGNIKFKDKDGNLFVPESENEKNPYPDNNWNASTNTYTNNSVISGKREVADFSSEVHEAALKVTAPEINLVNNGVIENEITVKSDTGDKSIYGYGIYVDSDLNGSLTNNGIITSITSKYAFGIYTSSALTGTLTNNGIITSDGDFWGTGIHIDSALTGTLTNNGIITVVASGKGSYKSYGIYLKYNSDSTGTLTNNGIIVTTSSGDNSYGIVLKLNSNENPTNNGLIPTNNGLITVSTFEQPASGICILSELNGTLTNNGTITGTSTGTEVSSLGYGIYIHSDLTANITNTGVIYGSTSAININSGTLEDLYNYGLLVTGGTDVISGTVTKLNNYGLAF